MNREDIDRMIKESGMTIHLGQSREKVIDQMGRFAAIVAASEREACAQVVMDQRGEPMQDDYEDYASARLFGAADAIRARGEE